MENKVENVMKYESVLPQGFDGTFRFTNWSDEDFVGKWGNKEYRFPAKSTSPIIIPEHSPLEVQQIRKKFAKDLAEREFSKSAKYKSLLAQERNNDGSPRLNSIHQAGTYSLDDMVSLIQQCLEPLPIAQAEVSEPKITPKEILEKKLTRNEEGEYNSQVVDKKISLKKKALES